MHKNICVIELKNDIHILVVDTMKPVNMGVLGEKSKAIQKIPLKISPYYMVKYWILKDKNDKYSHLLIKPEPYELYEINGVTI